MDSTDIPYYNFAPLNLRKFSIPSHLCSSLVIHLFVRFIALKIFIALSDHGDS